MTIWNPPSKPPSTRLLKGTAIFFGLVSWLGFLDAGFLALEHYRGAIPPCAIVSGCERVTASHYAVIFGVPVALLGAFYYLAIFILTIAWLDKRQPRLLMLAALLTTLGFIASVYFLALQIFIIKALCLYCLISIATSTLLFSGGIIFLIKKKIAEKK